MQYALRRPIWNALLLDESRQWDGKITKPTKKSEKQNKNNGNVH